MSKVIRRLARTVIRLIKWHDRWAFPNERAKGEWKGAGRWIIWPVIVSSVTFGYLLIRFEWLVQPRGLGARALGFAIGLAVLAIPMVASFTARHFWLRRLQKRRERRLRRMFPQFSGDPDSASEAAVKNEGGYDND